MNTFGRQVYVAWPLNRTKITRWRNNRGLYRKCRIHHPQMAGLAALTEKMAVNYLYSGDQERQIMSLTPSNMLPLGTFAPDFSLLNPKTGTIQSLDDIAGDKGLLVMFICNHCPFVKHIEAGLMKLGEDYSDSGIGMVAISSNDAFDYPEDGPGKIAVKSYPFPYLYDETQNVARAYQAACTPDLYLFDGNRLLVYRGQFDDSRPGNDTPVTGQDVRLAMDALLAGAPLPTNQKPSIGCNIKWRD